MVTTARESLSVQIMLVKLTAGGVVEVRLKNGLGCLRADSVDEWLGLSAVSWRNKKDVVIFGDSGKWQRPGLSLPVLRLVFW